MNRVWVKRNHLVFFLTLDYAALWAASMADNARGKLFPDIIHAFGLLDSQAALFFTVAALAGIPGSFGGGSLLRRYSSVASLRMAIVGMVSGLLIMALAPAYPLMLLGSAVYGLGIGAHQVVTNIMLTQATTIHNRARHFNFLQVMYSLASAVAPMAVIWWQRIFGGWQSAMGGLVIMPLLVLVVSWGVKLPSEFHPDKDKVTPSFWRVGARPACRYYSILMALDIAAEMCVTYWMVAYIMRLGSYSTLVSGAFLSVFFLLMSASRIVAGIWFARIAPHLILLIAASGAAVAILLGLYVHPFFIPLAAAPFGLFFPACFAAVSNELGDVMEAAMSWVMCSVYIGIGVMQIVMGSLSDLMSLHAALHLPVLLLMIVTVLLWLRPVVKDQAAGVISEVGGLKLQRRR